MSHLTRGTHPPALLQRLGGVAALALCLLSPHLALAGTCPAGKAGVGVRAPVSTPASGVTDTVIASIDVSKQPAHIEGRLFRLRKLVIRPGGVVPWHSHGDRPAIIYIISGTNWSAPSGLIDDMATH